MANALGSTQIRERIAQLKAQMEKIASDLNALAGALQDCEYWLGVAVKAEAEEKAVTGPHSS